MLVWNRAGIDAIRQASIEHPSEDPAYASRAMAMESLAVHDVLQAIHDKPGYLVDLDAPDGISTEAAISAAAHEILVKLYPGSERALDRLLHTSLRDVPDGQAEDEGVAFGRAVAEAVIANRANDGSAPLSMPGE
ncbi:hypothetical protein [Methylobacterium oxalidis]|uniref:hypothetical protein n=1 Tax=Methylobacterium oxalidis TaxID=944322 RepID=UPI003314C89E